MGCRNCGPIPIVNEDFSRREPTKEEFKKMRSDPESWEGAVKIMADTTRFLKKDFR